jgi:MoxR-like ATPase
MIERLLLGLLANGNLLVEGLPGLAKTRAIKSLSQALESEFSRIQFTPDLLPSDVTGVTIYDQNTRTFEFHRGPVFASIVLADEINRASPKTQSALLEVMEGSRITIDGQPHEVGRPFLVIATQNPIEQAGTYKLPEAQLDRFLIKTSIGYPDLAVAERILAGAADRNPSASLSAIITTGAVADMADLAATVHVEQAVLRYAAELSQATRADAGARLGVSVRGSLAMVRIAKVWAAAQGRNYVVPDDIKALAGPEWKHRIVLDPEAEFSGTTAETVVARALDAVAAPQSRSAA